MSASLSLGRSLSLDKSLMQAAHVAAVQRLVGSRFKSVKTRAGYMPYLPPLLNL